MPDAQRGDFGRPVTAPSAAARDTWRDQLAAVLDGEYGSDAALVDALMRVLVAAQQEAAAKALDEAAAYWDRPTVRTIAHNLRERAIALRAGDSS